METTESPTSPAYRSEAPLKTAPFVGIYSPEGLTRPTFPTTELLLSQRDLTCPVSAYQDFGQNRLLRVERLHGNGGWHDYFSRDFRG